MYSYHDVAIMNAIILAHNQMVGVDSIAIILLLRVIGEVLSHAWGHTGQVYC